MSRLIELLGARAGMVCAVGAGGKKTTLYHLASAHPGRVGLTCTVRHAVFPSTLEAHVVVAPVAEIVAAVVEAASRHRRVAFACPSEKKARHGGVPREQLEQIRRAAGFDVLLVKADGARMRWIKAPELDEPLLPAAADCIIPLVSARAIGRRLGEDIAHRPSRVAAVTGAQLGDRLEPEHVGRLLAHPEGALKDASDAQVCPVINMVDDAERARLAREAAQTALGLTRRFERVVLTATGRPDRLVEVVTRS